MFRMKVGILSCAAIGLAVVGAVWAAADPKEVAALAAVDQKWLKAYNSGDADGIAALYDENALLMPPGAPGVTGRAAIRAFFAKDTAESAKAGIVFGFGPKPAGDVYGDMGWQSGTYTVKDKSGKVLDTGKFLSVSVKKGGKWLYFRDTWNSDGAPPPAAGTSKK